MMSARRSILSTTLTALCALAGSLTLSSAPAWAAFAHIYQSQINGEATPAESFSPYGLAVDNSVSPSAGDVYVVDRRNHVVDKFNQAGVYQSQLTGPSSGSFGSPAGAAIDQSTGDLYVADFSNGVVDKFNASGESQPPLTGFSNPTGVAIDRSAGDLYVADYGGNVVDKFDPTTQTSIQFAAGFGQVYMVAVDNSSSLSTGDVYVVDFGNHVVDKFDSSGVLQSQLTGTEAAGGPSGSFGSPAGVAVDQSTGDLYVADFSNGVVDEFGPSGAYLSQIDGSGTPAGSFSPFLVAVDQSTGDVYVSDGGVNHVVDVFGPLVTVPDATTSAPTSVTRQTVTLNGSVNPDNTSATACRFEYGTSASYGQAVACSQAMPLTGNSPIPVSASVGGLQPATTYHYRLDATNSNGTSKGRDETFTTPPAVEGVKTEPATNVQAVCAMLNGFLEPNGFATQYWFEYGQSEAYGASTAKENAGEATERKPVNKSVCGLEPNEPYHYRLVGENTFGTTLGLDETLMTLPQPPEVENLPPSFVTFDGATLEATVNPENSETEYQFEYGPCETEAACPTSPYTGKTPLQSSSVYGVVETFHQIASLQPSSVYHYRLVATNSAGGASVRGPAEVTFTTAPIPSLVVESGAASAVTQNAAAISGSLDPNGLASSYGFEISTEAGVYGPAIGLGRLGAGFYEAKSVTLELADLQPGATYHYRFVASNAYATVTGADRTFTTTTALPSFTQPLAPPLIASPTITFPIEVKVKKLASAQIKACTRKPKRQRMACRHHAHKRHVHRK